MLSKWNDGIEQAIREGKTLLEISKTCLHTPSTPEEILAIHIFDLREDS
jgi:hypothetical protein